jgi:outer membrane protein
MRRWSSWIIGVGTILLSLGIGPGVSAESFKVGVIDPQKVLERTKAGKRALDSIKEFSSSRQKIIAADDEQLKQLENELKRQESGMSEVTKREKQEQFRTKLQNYQKRIQDFNREIQAKEKEMAEEYQKKIDEAAAAVAERQGYAAVLDKGNEATLRIVIYNQDAIDLTDEVIREFDRRNK